jgi:hypothetical protein
MKIQTRELLAAWARDKRELWEKFRDDRELIERLKITPDEVKMLERCTLLGTLTCKQDLLFILRQIREATRPVTAEKIVELRPTAAFEVSSEERASRVVRTSLTALLPRRG